MLAPLFMFIEKTLNPVLRSDPQTLNRLQALSGKIVQLNITDWRITVCILIYPHGIQLLENPSNVSADCEISGKLLDLFQVFCQQATTQSLFKHNIEVKDDHHIAEKIRDILKNLDIDWEDMLSKWLGDGATYFLGQKIKSVSNYFKKNTKIFQKNLVDYLQIEANYLPQSHMTDHFYSQIAQLRHDVERAELRLVRISKKLQHLDASK